MNIEKIIPLDQELVNIFGVNDKNLKCGKWENDFDSLKKRYDYRVGNVETRIVLSIDEADVKEFEKHLKKNFLQILFKSAFNLDEIGWSKLNNRWAYFFIFLALLNEVVWRTQSEAMWVNFKVWGILPLTFIFTAFQIPLINKHKI